MTSKQLGLFNRRMNRVGYALGHVYWLLLILGLATLLSPFEAVLTKPTAPIALLVSLLLVLLLVVVLMGLPLVFSLMIRRLHDLGHSWRFSLLWLIPGVNACLMVYLLLAKGEAQQNAYGRPVTDNSFLVALGLREPRSS